MIKFGGIQNHKHYAWDIMGSLFWKLGEDKIKPSPAMLTEYLTGITSQDHCCIIGASTFALIERAIDQGFDVTVMDFSEKMCADLEASLAPKKCTIILIDILENIPNSFKESFSHIFSDRIINRFSMTETQKFLQNVSLLLKPNGEFRTTVRMELYDLDKKMIQYQEAHSEQGKIYDVEKNTINFFNAKLALKELSPEMGKIPKEVLVEWYLNRGIESRYTEELIENFFLVDRGEPHGYFKILYKAPTPDSTPSFYYKLSLQKNE